MKYYSYLSGEYLWRYGEDRAVWRYILRYLENLPDTSVLDVGCFRGDLLKYLGERWQRFGVEPSTEASLEARRRGVTIIGDSIETLDSQGRQFGAITLIDVIEHLPEPLEALRKLTSLLKQGGRLVVFTGNTDAWSWRLSGLRYWYSSLPEHIGFFSPRWFQWAASRVGCTVISVKELPHKQVSMLNRLDEAIKNIAYITYHKLEALPLASNILPRLPVIQRVGCWDGSWWTSATDHILVVMIKQ